MDEFYMNLPEKIFYPDFLGGGHAGRLCQLKLTWVTESLGYKLECIWRRGEAHKKPTREHCSGTPV